MLVPPFCGNWFSPWRTVEKHGIFYFLKRIFSLSFGRYYFLLVSRQKQIYESTIEVNSGKKKLRRSSLRFTRMCLEVSFMLSFGKLGFLVCGMHMIHGVLRIHFSFTGENLGRFTLSYNHAEKQQKSPITTVNIWGDPRIEVRTQWGE